MEVVDALTAPLTTDNSLATQSPVASPFSLKYQVESPGSPIVCHLTFITYEISAASLKLKPGGPTQASGPVFNFAVISIRD
jgi:hypothetical protein